MNGHSGAVRVRRAPSGCPGAARRCSLAPGRGPSRPVGWAPVGTRVTLLTDAFVLPPQNVRIDPSSLSFNMWKEIPVPFYLSVYFFDVVNPSAVLLGEKPQVRERGPYVYR